MTDSFNTFAVGFHPAGTDAGDLHLRVDFDAQVSELGFGFGGEIRGIGRQHARAAIEQHHAALGGIDVAEVVAHVELGDVADGAGQFDARWVRRR